MKFTNYPILIWKEKNSWSSGSRKLIMKVLTENQELFQQMKKKRVSTDQSSSLLSSDFTAWKKVQLHNVWVSVPLLHNGEDDIWSLWVVAQKRDDGTVLKHISGYVNWWNRYDDRFTATAIDELSEELVVENNEKQKVLKWIWPSINWTPEQIIQTRNPYCGMLSESFYRLHHVSWDLEIWAFSNFWGGNISVEYEDHVFELHDVLFHIDGHHGSWQILFPKVISFGDNIQNIRFAESTHINGKEEHRLQWYMPWIQLDDCWNLTWKVDEFKDGSRQACCIDPEKVNLSEAFAVSNWVSMKPNVLFSQMLEN